MKIRRGDQVLVTVGDNASSTPHKVVQVLEEGGKLLIEGVNVVKKHVRRGHPKSPQGGRLDLEMPIQASNCRYYCSSCHAGTRLGLRYTDEGRKERYCKKCGASAGTIGAAKTARAKN